MVVAQLRATLSKQLYHDPRDQSHNGGTGPSDILLFYFRKLNWLCWDRSQQHILEKMFSSLNQFDEALIVFYERYNMFRWAEKTSIRICKVLWA